jgi:TatD DNase family protein
MYRLVDTHAHLEQIEDLEQALTEARRSGVAAIVAVGCDLESNREALRLASLHKEYVYPALGWHPWYMREAGVAPNLEFIEAHADEAVAVGEVGLDYHKRVREGADKDLQKRVLREILNIAKAHDKPVSLHSRYAWRDALEIVEASGVARVVFHWYTGTSGVLRDIIERGYYISATPAVEYHEEHRRAIKEAPLERLMLETDAPVIYHRGSPGEYESSPADARRSLKGAAALKGVSEAELAEATTDNAIRFFGIG